jgi:hypothetical protein
MFMVVQTPSKMQKDTILHLAAGTFHYRDVSGVERTTSFCYEVTKDGEFRAYDKYNEMK